MGKFFYFIKEAIRGFYQAKLMTFVSIFTVSASLFLICIIGIALSNVNLLLRNAGEQADIAVYVTDATAIDEQKKSEIINRIRQLKQVENVLFVSKQMAWDRFAALYGEELLEAVDENPLPASFEIYLGEAYHSTEHAESVKEELEKIAGIDGVQYSWEWMKRIEQFRSYFWLAALVLSVFIFIALHFIISNTIKLTIYARKELVRNMHFVGATDLFIRMPFILEGILQGMIGGIVSVIILFIVRWMLSHVPIYWDPRMPLAVVVVGIVFGWLGSFSAVRKFLV